MVPETLSASLRDLTGNGGAKEVTPIGVQIPRSLIQEFDLLHEPSHKEHRGLDLYCGGHNFGRGLEEGQVVEWAVDMNKISIDIYFANIQDPRDTTLYFGSDNDQLFQAMQGSPKRLNLIPRPGEIDFISAESTCQSLASRSILMMLRKRG